MDESVLKMILKLEVKNLLKNFNGTRKMQVESGFSDQKIMGPI